MVTGPLLLLVFLVAIGFVLTAILFFKLNPFIVLLLAGVLTGFLVGMPIDKIGNGLAAGFGGTPYWCRYSNRTGYRAWDKFWRRLMQQIR